MSRFYIGQPVVLVHDNWPSFWSSKWARGSTRPVKGQKYHVRSYQYDAPPPLCMTLMEITNPMVRWSDGVEREAGFAETRFAPITDEQVRGIIEEAIKTPQTIRKYEEVDQ